MIEVNSHARWALPSLEAVPLNTGFARVIVEGQLTGNLWVDRPESPLAMHALHPYGMSLIWGDPTADAINDLVRHLREASYRQGDEWLQIDPRWPVSELDVRLGATDPDQAFGSGNCIRHTRVNFSFNAEDFRALKCTVPLGWRLRPVTAEDFQFRGQVVPNRFWNDAESFIAVGGGWCAEESGRVGAIAFVSYRWADQMEIGIETLEHARRKGLGRAVACRLIADVLQKAHTPVWSCRLDNMASYALALQLGFKPSINVPYYHLFGRAVGGARA